MGLGCLDPGEAIEVKLALCVVAMHIFGRQRTDLPLRPGRRAAIADHRHAPKRFTSARSCSSSSGVQNVMRPVFTLSAGCGTGLLTATDASTGGTTGALGSASSLASR